MNDMKKRRYTEYRRMLIRRAFTVGYSEPDIKDMFSTFSNSIIESTLEEVRLSKLNNKIIDLGYLS